jgi:uncharacterized protein (DUF1499 family)
MFRSWPLRISLLASILVGLGPALAYYRVLPGHVSLLLFGVGALVGLVGIVSGALDSARGRLGTGLTAVVLGIVCVVVVLLPAFAGGGRPPINDLTTNRVDVPQFTHAQTLPENKGRDLSYPDEFKPIVEASYPGLDTLTLHEPPDIVFERTLILAKAQPGWTVTHEDRKALVLEGVVETKVFRFKDDFVVRLRPAEDGGTKVDMRSKSRVGRGDLGANALRIWAFFRALRASND